MAPTSAAIGVGGGMGDRASGGVETAVKDDDEALSIFQSLLFEEDDKSASEIAAPGAEKSGGGGEGDESPSRVFTIRFRRGSQAVPAAAALTAL
jgi:hypothetical protein